jgi:hypothetical protein
MFRIQNVYALMPRFLAEQWLCNTADMWGSEICFRLIVRVTSDLATTVSFHVLPISLFAILPYTSSVALYMLC